MQPWCRFLLVGLLVAGLEEFITHGVLEDDFDGRVVLHRGAARRW
jgi:hypothetical protein